MTWLALISAAVKSLPIILDIVSRFKAAADAKVNQGIGYDQAVADGLVAVRDQLAGIDQAVEQAKAKQAAHPGRDDGRDTQFRRD